MIVLDTNIVLDLFIFQDPTLAPLKQAVQTKQLQWLATAPMRQELVRVLTYPHIRKRMQKDGTKAEQAITAFDTLAQLQNPAPKAPWTCKDPDDQIFIDLAVAHKTSLLSKDKAVLSMRKRLSASAVRCFIAIDFAAKNFPPVSEPSSI